MAQGGGRTGAIVAAVIGAVGAIVAAVIGLANHSDGPAPSSSSGAPPPATTSASVEAAQLVQRCETAHGMRQQTERSADPAGTMITFAACAWPPPPAAESDGYTRIVATAEDGPGKDTASVSDTVDRVRGRCSTFSLEYTDASQGAVTHLPAFTVQTGAVVEVDQPDRPYSGQLPFVQDRGETDILRNNRYELDAASCAG